MMRAPGESNEKTRQWPAAVGAFVERARERLDKTPPERLFDPFLRLSRGDHELSPEMTEFMASMPPRHAAVLVPIIGRAEPTVLLTLRSSELPDHAGQVAFPGGKIDPADPDPLATALREAEEEIGLAARYATPLGYLDAYLSGTGFRIVPVVAVIEPGFELLLNPSEVEDAFEVPLAFLMSPDNHARHSREWRGKQRSYYAMPFGERYIWGATAGILRNLYERLYR
jgi:8-oxo-dGTP pyrophosphatase MutT (NUDIX family)